MKLFTIAFMLLLGFLAACGSKDGLPDVDGFDIEVLTREEGWQIDSVCTGQSGGQMITEIKKWEKQMKTKYAKDEPVLKFVDENLQGSALMMLLLIEGFFGKNSTIKKKTPIYFKQDTANYVMVSSDYTKGDTLRLKLATFQNKANLVYTDKKDTKVQLIQKIETLTDDKLLVEFALLTVPKDSLDPIYKLSEQERYLRYWRLCLKPKK